MFEEEDRQRRPSLLPLGTEGDGGLYRRVWWRLFKNCGCGITQTVLDRLTEPRQWYGALQASIRRAFAALGSVRISVLDPGIEQQLLQLRRLYFENIDGQDLVIEPALKARYTLNKRHFEGDSDTMQSPPKRRPQSMPDVMSYQTAPVSEDHHVEDGHTYSVNPGRSASHRRI
ncbi:hypothetical protein N7513_012933 [Penicillium frequentans]|nr:hypothetical protein N7513_012933 [Penicillium glabrum]